MNDDNDYVSSDDDSKSDNSDELFSNFQILKQKSHTGGTYEYDNDNDDEESEDDNNVDSDDDDDDDDDDKDNNEDENEDENNMILPTNISDKNEENNDDDNDDDNDEDYLQKFDKEINKNYVQEFHPECYNHNFDEIQKSSIVFRNDDDIIIDPLHKTIPFLTKYEKAKILGQRAKQIECGANPFIDISNSIIDSYLIAELELKAKKIPFIIRRPIPGGGFEYWNLKDLEDILF